MPTTNQPMPQTYGDHITSAGPDSNGHLYGVGNGVTPDVAVSYAASSGGAGGAVVNYATGPAHLSNVAFLLTNNPAPSDPTTRKFTFTFTPDAAYVRIRVNSFQLADWASNAQHTITWTAYKGSVLPINVLATNTVTVPASGTASVLTVSTGLGYTANTVILEIRHDAGSRNNLVLDNLNFDQLVPEPASSVALMMGTVALMFRRSKQRQS